MFEKGLDENKIKLKTLIGLSKLSKNYPDVDDLEYYLVNYANGYEKSEDIIISDINVAGYFKIEIERARELISSSSIITYLKSTDKKQIYKIVKNPFI